MSRATTEDAAEAPDRAGDAPHPSEAEALFGHDAAEAEVLAAFNTGRMHSGWLIAGPKGIGKATLAYRIARFLLAAPPAKPAGLFGAPSPPETLAIDPDHPDARLIRAGAHPRLMVLRRSLDERTGRLRSQIVVDDVRRLRAFFGLSATDGGHRVVIVDPADEMTTSAANALLKVLEEPPARTTLLLVAHQPMALLPTIRSRCRIFRLAPLQAPDLARALDAAGLPVAGDAATAVLTGGSAGAAVRLAAGDGAALYSEIVGLFEGLPRLDRARAIRLAEACAGRGAELRYELTVELIDLFLARAARAGLLGEPSAQAAPHEARLLARLAPHDVAARRWALLHQELGARIRHGRAVNLDPAALILDMVLRIEETARSLGPA